MDAETKQRAETITKPATRWRNRWFNDGEAVERNCGTHGAEVLPSGEHFGCGTYPSREIAEEQALAFARECRGDHLRACWRGFIYLGAVPVEEDQ